MPSSIAGRVRLAGAFAVFAAIPLAPLAAQQVQPGRNSPTQSAMRDAADDLGVHLRVLARSPNDVNALIGAGEAALGVGDYNAALGFFGRADENAPRNGRAKAGLASVMVMMEKPAEALRLFGEAENLGIPLPVLAADRGLAYDLRGDNRRAQREYVIALRWRPNDDEVTRRYALSLGISGDRDEALKLLDPLLYKRDQSAWRARAFVLALTGDLNGANGITRQVMPARMADAMEPFMRRLAKLNAAEQALAVTFGTMPSDGTTYAMVETGDPFRPVGSSGNALVPAGEPLGPRTADAQQRKPEPASRDPRRRPGPAREERVRVAALQPPKAEVAPPAAKPVVPAAPTPAQTVASAETRAPQPLGRLETRVGGRIGPVDPARLPPELRGDAQNKPVVAVLTAQTALPPPSSAAPPQPAPPPAAAGGPSVTADLMPGIPPATQSAPRFETTPAPATSLMGPKLPEPQPAPRMRSSSIAGAPASAAEPARAPLVSETVTRARPEVGFTGTRLAGLLAGIAPEEESVAGPLPTAAELRAQQAAARKRAAAEAEAAARAKAEKDVKDTLRAAAARHPARQWVQIATGANETGLPGTWKRLRDGAPKMFQGLSAWSVPFKATNRLLVGPFKSVADARVLLNGMAKAGMAGSLFSSTPGQEIARVGK